MKKNNLKYCPYCGEKLPDCEGGHFFSHRLPSVPATKTWPSSDYLGQDISGCLENKEQNNFSLKNNKYSHRHPVLQVCLLLKDELLKPDQYHADVNQYVRNEMWVDGAIKQVIKHIINEEEK